MKLFDLGSLLPTSLGKHLPPRQRGTARVGTLQQPRSPLGWHPKGCVKDCWEESQELSDGSVRGPGYAEGVPTPRGPLCYRDGWAPEEAPVGRVGSPVGRQQSLGGVPSTPGLDPSTSGGTEIARDFWRPCQI